ncbi:hypothetical protein IAT40_004789 [Kwoniella sp. CBS 6097]
MSKLFLAITFIWLGSVVLPAAANNVFIGCFNSVPDGSVLMNADTTPANVDLPSSSPTCTQACEAYGNHYSLWQSSSASCYCSATSPSAMYSYISNGDAESCSTNTLYHSRMIQTSMSLVGQYASVSFANSEEYAVVQTAQDCFQHCVASTQATFMVNRGASPQNFRCWCSPLSNAGAISSSGDAYFVYNHAAGAYGNEASTFVKRQMRERLEIARERALLAVCPSHLTACKVSSSDEYSFECIDTQSELESCGGCTFGEFNNATAPLGQDCNTIGSVMGASTCLAGRCVSFACKRGYTLVDGQCKAQGCYRQGSAAFHAMASCERA